LSGYHAAKRIDDELGQDVRTASSQIKRQREEKNARGVFD